ncbi:unnamed protein product, partial [Prorocentrum cordatum]
PFWLKPLGRSWPRVPRRRRGGAMEALAASPAAQAAFGAAMAILASGCSARQSAFLLTAVARGTAFGGCGKKDVEGAGISLVLQEEVLVAVQRGLGLASKPSLSKAKEFLRARGGQALASRLGRVSKIRNSSAHLDVGLPGDVDLFLSDGSETEGDQDGKLSEEAYEEDSTKDHGKSCKERIQKDSEAAKQHLHELQGQVEKLQLTVQDLMRSQKDIKKVNEELQGVGILGDTLQVASVAPYAKQEQFQTFEGKDKDKDKEKNENLNMQAERKVQLTEAMDGQVSKQADEMAKQARNGLLDYCCTLHNTFLEAEARDKFKDEDKEKIGKAIDNTLDWLEDQADGKSAADSKQELERKHHELEGIVNPIMMKLGRKLEQEHQKGDGESNTVSLSDVAAQKIKTDSEKQDVEAHDERKDEPVPPWERDESDDDEHWKALKQRHRVRGADA